MTGQEAGGDLGQRSSEVKSDGNRIADSDRTDEEQPREMMMMIKKKKWVREGMVGAICREAKTLTLALERVLMARALERERRKP